MSQTPNLEIEHIVTSQSSKEVTANEAFDLLDQSVNSEVSITVAASFTLSDAQFLEVGYVKLTAGAVAAPFTVTAPNNARLVCFKNSTGYTATIQHATTTATVALADGDLALLRFNGSTRVEKIAGFETPVADPFDLGLWFSGAPAASAVLLRFVAVRAFTLPASLTGSQGYATTVSTGSVTVDLQKNGSSQGSVNFAAGAHTATFTFSGSVSWAAGDLLELVAPGSADATWANISLTLKGTR